MWQFMQKHTQHTYQLNLIICIYCTPFRHWSVNLQIVYLWMHNIDSIYTYNDLVVGKSPALRNRNGKKNRLETDLQVNKVVMHFDLQKFLIEVAHWQKIFYLIVQKFENYNITYTLAWMPHWKCSTGWA